MIDPRISSDSGPPIFMDSILDMDDGWIQMKGSMDLMDKHLDGNGLWDP